MLISKQLFYQEKANVLDNIPENFLLPLTSVVINPNETFYGLPCQITTKYGLPGLLMHSITNIKLEAKAYSLANIKSYNF